MAQYRIFENGNEVNTIVADDAFCETYCEAHGFTYELMPEPEIVEPEPTTDEIINAMLGVTE